MHPGSTLLPRKLYLLRELTFWPPLSPHQAVQSLPDKKAVKPLGEAPMEMSECWISFEPPALNRQELQRRPNVASFLASPVTYI